MIITGWTFCKCSNSHWSHSCLFCAQIVKKSVKICRWLCPSLRLSVCLISRVYLTRLGWLTHWSHFSQPGWPLFRSQSPVRKSHWLNVADNLILSRSDVVADSRHPMTQLTRQGIFLVVVTFVCALQALFIRFVDRYLMFTLEEGYLRLLLLCLLFLSPFNIYVEENDECLS